MTDLSHRFEVEFDIDPPESAPTLCLGGATAAQHNRILRRLGPLQTRCSDMDIHLTPDPTARATAPDNAIWFDLHCNGQTITIGLAPDLLDAPFTRLTGEDQDYDPVSDDVRLNVLFDPLLTRLEARLEGSISVDGAPAPPRKAIRRGFRLSLNGTEGFLVLAAEPHAFALVDRVLDLLPSTPGTPWPLPVATALILGTQNVPQGDLARLARGDAFLPRPVDLAEAGATLRLAGRPTASMVIAGTQAVVTDLSPPEPPAGPPKTGDVQVSFEMPCPAIDHQVAQALVPGRRLAMGSTVEDAVIDIWVGPRRLARGRLIHVGSHRAIQVTELGSNWLRAP